MTDLQKFNKAFDHDKVKEFTGKLEYRVTDLDASVARARNIIDQAKLKLTVITDGQMASYNAFEVREN